MKMIFEIKGETPQEEQEAYKTICADLSLTLRLLCDSGVKVAIVDGK